MLGHVNKNVKTFGQYGIYSGGQSNTQVKPIYEDQQEQVFQRPNLQYINYELLLKSKKSLDIAVWSSQDRENTEVQISHFIGRFIR